MTALFWITAHLIVLVPLVILLKQFRHGKLGGWQFASVAALTLVLLIVFLFSSGLAEKYECRFGDGVFCLSSARSDYAHKIQEWERGAARAKAMSGTSLIILKALANDTDAYYDVLSIHHTRSNEFWSVASDTINTLNYSFRDYAPMPKAMFIENPNDYLSMELTYRTLMWPGPAVRRVIIDRLGKSASTNTDHIVLGHLLSEPDLSVVAACIHALNARFGANTGPLDRGSWIQRSETTPDRYLYTLVAHQGMDAHGKITTIKGYLNNDDGVMPDAKEWAIQYLNKLDSEIETGQVNICRLWGLTGMMARITEARFKSSNEPILRPVMELIDISTNKIPFPYDVYMSLDIPENRHNDKVSSK